MHDWCGEWAHVSDPTASDEMWQIETILDGENQVILSRLTPNSRVYVKVRAKGPAGSSTFSKTVNVDTVPQYREQPQGDIWRK